MTQAKHKNIYVALAAAQAEMTHAKKGAENPHFKSKYADLSEVVDAVKPALTKHGITYFHIIDTSDFGHTMITKLIHGESETEITCPVPLIIGKQDMQGFKSATTYAKRIGLESVTGLATDDDDGNAAAATVTQKMTGGLDDAWKAGVLDKLPDNATGEQKARAFADAIMEEFAAKTGQKALSNAWDRRKKLIAQIEGKFPDMHTEIVDAYENRMMDLTPKEAAE